MKNNNNKKNIALTCTRKHVLDVLLQKIMYTAKLVYWYVTKHRVMFIMLKIALVHR